MALKLDFSKQNSTLVVKIDGELDHHTSSYVSQKVDGELLKPQVKDVIFDFSDVNFMDSSGIGVIMGRYKNILRSNGKLAIIGLSPKVKKIFELSGLLKVITVYDSLESYNKKM